MQATDTETTGAETTTERALKASEWLALSNAHNAHENLEFSRFCLETAIDANDWTETVTRKLNTEQDALFVKWAKAAGVYQEPMTPPIDVTGLDRAALFAAFLFVLFPLSGIRGV